MTEVASSAEQTRPRWRGPLAGLATNPQYAQLNIAATIIAVFALPVTGLLAHMVDPAQVEDWRSIAFGIEIAATVFFIFDVFVGFAASGKRYVRDANFWINMLAIGAVFAELLAQSTGLANARILRALQGVRAIAKVGLLLRGGTTDSVLGAEAVRRLNQQDVWYALALLGLMVVLGDFNLGQYPTAMDAIVEIVVFAGFILAMRWKAARNMAQVEQVFIRRLRDANARVIDRMREIPGLEDADQMILERADSLRDQGSPVSEIEMFVEAIGMILGNLRRFISRRTFAEARGEEVLSPDRPIALMFTDVEGFSRIAESMRQEIIPVLQYYLGDMSARVSQHDGDVDKFIGDAVFAYFDNPDAPDRSANQAFDAALAMQQQCRLLAEASAEWSRMFADAPDWERFREWRTRFGLHWGSVVAGPIGSDERADSTLIGDDVNLTARLEALCKKYGIYILMSEVFYRALSHDRQDRCRWIDTVTVAGREDSPFRLFTVDTRVFPANFMDRFVDARDTYLEGQWQAAHDKFRAAQETLKAAGLEPDPVSAALMSRIEANRDFWFRAVDHMHARAPDVVNEDLKERLLETRRGLPFQAPVTWPGFWRHEK